MHNQPILIFDSGVGGLSILDAVREKLPHETYVYVCDNAAFPYGPKSEEILVQRVQQVLDAAIARVQPKLLIVACNTASTIALPSVRAHYDMPVVGVVPAIKPAARLSQSGVIGLLATPGTIARRYTDDLIREFAAGCDVIRVGSRELVVIAEEYLRGTPPSHQTLREILSPFFQETRRHADVIVLGCTHFPLLRDALSAATPTMVQWVDSGAAIARRVHALLPYTATEISSSYALFTREDPRLDLLQPALSSRTLRRYDIMSLPFEESTP